MKLNTIYNEDCLETMARMPDGFIDLVVTSPPYDNLREYNWFKFDFDAIAKELFRVVKKGGVVVWVVGDATINGSETGTSFKQALYFKEIGFNLHDTMIYQTDKPPMNDRRYQSSFEYMFILSKDKPKTFNPIKTKTKTKGYGGGTYRASDGTLKERFHNYKVSDTFCLINIWKYSTGVYQTTNDIDAFKHPAMFPEKLAADHIVSWSNEGDLVYDCFGGSGTTAKMAITYKRNWILSEISKEYSELAQKRIEQFQSQTVMELL